jgi:hypothetical protein
MRHMRNEQVVKEKLKKRAHLEDLGQKRKIILKWIISM